MGAAAPAPRLLRLKPEDAVRTGHAPLQKGKFTWVTEPGRRERWIAASCGTYTVLWNFRQVRLAEPDTVSYGGLTTCTAYHLIPKGESVVDSLFVHDRFAPGGGGTPGKTPPPGRRGAGGGGTPGRDESSMVIVTEKHVFSTAENDE